MNPKYAGCAMRNPHRQASSKTFALNGMLQDTGGRDRGSHVERLSFRRLSTSIHSSCQMEWRDQWWWWSWWWRELRQRELRQRELLKLRQREYGYTSICITYFSISMYAILLAQELTIACSMHQAIDHTFGIGRIRSF